MKKLIVALLIGCAGMVSADPATILRSSFTNTNDTNLYISSSGYLDAVIIGVASAGGFLSIFNSTYTNTVMVSSISLATVGERHFNGILLKGITYTTVGNTGGITIIYRQSK